MIICPHWNIGQRNTSPPQHQKPSASKCMYTYTHKHIQYNRFVNKTSLLVLQESGINASGSEDCDTEDIFVKFNHTLKPKTSMSKVFPT